MRGDARPLLEALHDHEQGGRVARGHRACKVDRPVRFDRERVLPERLEELRRQVGGAACEPRRVRGENDASKADEPDEDSQWTTVPKVRLCLTTLLSILLSILLISSAGAARVGTAGPASDLTAGRAPCSAR